MDTATLQSILDRFPKCRILVFGDFFLDKYLEIDPSLNEVSIETGLTAYQIVGKRLQPGAAGTVCNNLSALGIGKIVALSVIGDDGEGYELQKALQSRGVDISNLIVTDQRFTPTYTKPMLQHMTGEEEIERQDIKNRRRLHSWLETELKVRLEKLLPEVNAVIISDQVQERNCGVVTDRLRDYLSEIAPHYPQTVFFVDSRERIGEFQNMTVKPNRFEATMAIHPDYDDDPPTPFAVECAKQLHQKNGRPVFLTLDKEGICAIANNKTVTIPCPPVAGPIDIVGAGDSVTAGIVSSLASGATEAQAAGIGNLVASITIRQLGTTGTASPAQIMEAWEQNQELYKKLD
ncbi:MAG: carbohydrate kinase [Candidatus Omnitrophota bacterium]|jgi:rfaE bifunctional protein kinase chain/domain|nr:MAG: carbohydrate kinase [Candidatus Omnitrophota bacterium]